MTLIHVWLGEACIKEACHTWCSKYDERDEHDMATSKPSQHRCEVVNVQCSMSFLEQTQTPVEIAPGGFRWHPFPPTNLLAGELAVSSAEHFRVMRREQNRKTATQDA